MFRTSVRRTGFLTGSRENAQAVAASERWRTTKLYNRANDQITLDKVEKIGI